MDFVCKYVVLGVTLTPPQSITHLVNSFKSSEVSISRFELPTFSYQVPIPFVEESSRKNKQTHDMGLIKPWSSAVSENKAKTDSHIFIGNEIFSKFGIFTFIIICREIKKTKISDH